jgi:hypothetical protein
VTLKLQKVVPKLIGDVFIMSEHDTLSNPERHSAQWFSIPAFVMFDEELSPQQKLLYGFIQGLTGRTGYCYATNAYLEAKLKISERSIRRDIEAISERGYMRVEIVGPVGKQRRHVYLETRPAQQLELEDPLTPPADYCTPPGKNAGSPPAKMSGRISNINTTSNITPIDITRASNSNDVLIEEQRTESLPALSVTRNPEVLAKGPWAEKMKPTLDCKYQFAQVFERLVLNHPQAKNAAGNALNTRGGIDELLEVLRFQAIFRINQKPSGAHYLDRIVGDLINERAAERLKAKKMADEALQSGERLKTQQARTVAIERGAMTFAQRDQADADARNAIVAAYHREKRL